MDRETVMALSDEELRVRAAEILGFRWFKNANGRRFMGMPDEGGCIAAESTVAVALDALRLVPDYPRDIAAAWGLVDRMVEAGHDVAVHAYQSAEDHVSPFSTWCTVDENDDLDSGGTAAPRAITRAFVLAMTQEKP